MNLSAIRFNLRGPNILFNLTTFSYNERNLKSLLCGFQLNRQKEEFEQFLTKLQEAGATIEFVIKKPNIDEKSFMTRRLEDYKIACFIIDKIKEVGNLEKLADTFHDLASFPYNIAILATLVQSAKKFGPVHCQNESESCNPAIAQIQLAKSRNIDFLMGLDTYYFIFGCDIKVWSDLNFDMKKGVLLEFDPKIITQYFKLNHEKAALFAALTTTSGSAKFEIVIDRGLKKTLQNYFGFGSRDYFRNVAKFVQTVDSSHTAEMTVNNVLEKIINNNIESHDEKMVAEIADFMKLLRSFDSLENFESDSQVSSERAIAIKNDFSNFGDAILKGNPIFLNPVFLDLRQSDTKSLIELVKPLLVKTAGALMQEFNVQRDIHVITLDEHNGKFVKLVLQPETSEEPFDFWNSIAELSSNLQNDIDTLIPSEYRLDVYVLIYLLKTESILLIEARIIMATLAEVRKRRHLVNPDYPEAVVERA